MQFKNANLIHFDWENVAKHNFQELYHLRYMTAGFAGLRNVSERIHTTNIKQKDQIMFNNL